MPAQEALSLVPGNRVFDREKEGQTSMVVVDTPSKSASRRKVPGTGKTVAEFNPKYPEDSDVVTVAFENQVREHLPEWESLDSEDFREAISELSIKLYDYPKPRLIRHSATLPDHIETYHDLICYQNARLIQLAAGVPYSGFLWKRYHQLKEGEYEMATITKENQYQLKEDFGVCIYCKEETETTFDHIVPLANGGSDDISNQVPACPHCNSSKSDKDVIQWCKEQGEPVPRIVWGKYIKQVEEKLVDEGRLHDPLPEEEREKWNGVELQRNITERIYKRERGTSSTT